MVVITHKPGKKDDGLISFPTLQCWNPVTKTATIAAQVNGRRVCCKVKFEDLKKKFHIFSDEPMQSVVEYRAEIENAARKLIQSNDYQTDGSILINYRDL